MTEPTKLPEPEGLAMLRHRFGRTIEIWIAYSVFLNREIEIGPGKTCFDEAVLEQTTHTLNMVLYSFLFSMFDRSGVSFPKITAPLLEQLTPAAREARAMVVEAEHRIHGELARIRNNIGFHQGARRKSHRDGYDAYKAFHPGIPVLIMQGLRVFFREADKTYGSAEDYVIPVDDEVTDELLRLCRDLKREIAEDAGSDIASMLINLGQRMKASA